MNRILISLGLILAAGQFSSAFDKPKVELEPLAAPLLAQGEGTSGPLEDKGRDLVPLLLPVLIS